MRELAVPLHREVLELEVLEGRGEGPEALEADGVVAHVQPLDLAARAPAVTFNGAPFNGAPFNDVVYAI